MNDELIEEQSNNSDAKIRFRTLAAQGSCAEGLAVLDALDKKTFVEALSHIPNVGTDDDFERINNKNDAAVTCLDIPVINQTAEETQEDIDTLNQWLSD